MRPRFPLSHLPTDEQNVEAQNARVFNNPIFKLLLGRLEPHV
jgi:hypothetical protein